MDKISGAFGLNRKNIGHLRHQNTLNASFSCDFFYFNTERIADSPVKQKTFVYDEKTSTVISLIGTIHNFSELCDLIYFQASTDVDLVAELYRRKKDKFLRELDGLYTLLKYDVRQHTLTLYQDIFSSPLNLYYCISDGILFFSTNLKELLTMSGIERELDKIGVMHFLRKSCIPSEHTLIKTIFKLIPGQYLQITANSDRPRKYRRPPVKANDLSQDTCKKDYYKIFERSVKRSIDSLDEINISLSSGFDSNFLLYAAQELSDHKIRVFTIGGKEGRDERKKAGDISMLYRNVEPHEQLIEEKVFESLPEIVWRQEDLVYLDSNFVKLQLAKLAKEKGCMTLVSGDCCDEVLTGPKRVRLKTKFMEFAKSVFFVRRVFCLTKRKEVNSACFKCGFNRKIKTTVFELGTYRILKHVGTMLNSFSIGLRLPYMDGAFVSCAGRLRHLNKDKAFHHHFVREYLPESVTELIEHLGGSIDEDFMFKNYQETICQRLTRSELAQKFIGSHTIDNMVKEPLLHMEHILRMLYIEIFAAIFTTGTYDHTFDQPHFNTTLSQVLKND